MMSSIQQLLADMKNLVPVPAIVSQIIAVVDEPGSSADDIASVIQYDPAMTVSLIRTCNSAFFGLRTPVESIRDAVAILGIDQIVEIVLLKACGPGLMKSQKGYHLPKGELWKNAVYSAIVAKAIAGRICPAEKNMLFTAALLKDIGKTVLDRFVVDSSDRINDLVANRGYGFREAEKKVIGIDHAELGALIAGMWKFSPTMVRIIRHHHLSEEVMHKERDIAVVYLADCICMMMGIGIGADGLAYRFHENVMMYLGINSQEFSAIIADVVMDMDAIEGLIAAAAA